MAAECLWAGRWRQVAAECVRGRVRECAGLSTKRGTAHSAACESGAVPVRGPHLLHPLKGLLLLPQQLQAGHVVFMPSGGGLIL